VIEEDYPYNTEFGDGHTHEEMEEIDRNNQKQYAELVVSQAEEDEILGV
jgi:hypothetical protein